MESIKTQKQTNVKVLFSEQPDNCGWLPYPPLFTLFPYQPLSNRPLCSPSPLSPFNLSPPPLFTLPCTPFSSLSILHCLPLLVHSPPPLLLDPLFFSPFSCISCPFSYIALSVSNLLFTLYTFSFSLASPSPTKPFPFPSNNFSLFLIPFKVTKSTLRRIVSSPPQNSQKLFSFYYLEFLVRKT